MIIVCFLLLGSCVMPWEGVLQWSKFEPLNCGGLSQLFFSWVESYPYQNAFLVKVSNFSIYMINQEQFLNRIHLLAFGRAFICREFYHSLRAVSSYPASWAMTLSWPYRMSKSSSFIFSHNDHDRFQLGFFFVMKKCLRIYNKKRIYLKSTFYGAWND